MTRTLETLTLAALVTFTVTLTGCDSPDRDVDDAAPRTKVLYTDAASLEALAESESEIQDVVAEQLGIDGDALLDIALDPAGSPGVTLTAPPAPVASGPCVSLNDVLDFCHFKTTTGVTAWVELLGVSSPHKYLSLSGACTEGELVAGFATADYAICTAPIPIPQVIVTAETCTLGICDDVAYVKLFP